MRLNKINEIDYLQDLSKVHEIFYKALFIELVIELDYLFFKSIVRSKLKSVSFKDDIPVYNKSDGKYENIRDLIKYIRNTICHADDLKKRENELTGQYFAYTIRTYADFNYTVEGYNQCPYKDEIAVVFGEHVIFVKRHLLRALHEITSIVLGLPEFIMYKNWIKDK